MGLDVLEIIMKCEDVFEISIPDRDVEKVFTAGDLHALVMRRLGERQGICVCPSSRMFYRLRKKLMGLGMPRRMARPDTRLSEIAEELGNDRATEIRNVLEMPLDIRKPAWAEMVVLGGAIAAGIAARFVWRDGGLWSGIGAAIVAGYLLYLVTMPVRLELTMNDSLRDITYARIARQRREKGRAQTFSEAEAWEILRGILAEQFAVPMEAIKPETRFMEDLGAG